MLLVLLACHGPTKDEKESRQAPAASTTSAAPAPTPLASPSTAAEGLPPAPPPPGSISAANVAAVNRRITDAASPPGVVKDRQAASAAPTAPPEPPAPPAAAGAAAKAKRTPMLDDQPYGPSDAGSSTTPQADDFSKRAMPNDSPYK